MESTHLLPDKKNILICPLNWGIGHATRCIPIINDYLQKGNNVIIASDGRPFELLQKRYPELEFIRFPSYNIFYSENGVTISHMLLQIPQIISGIFREHRQLKKIVKEKKIDIVISDNRFGLWNSPAKTIYITHQVMIKMPEKLKALEPILYRLHKWIIHKFDECHIPDFKDGMNLSGDLSHKYPVPQNAFFIGILSRFENLKLTPLNKYFDVVAIVSGPEPQRTIFEKLIIKHLAKIPQTVLIISGKPENTYNKQIENITIISHCNDNEMANYVINAKTIICRSGYSTLMDLFTLGKTAILVPTPGQTEQEYLAQTAKQNLHFKAIDQKDFMKIAEIL